MLIVIVGYCYHFCLMSIFFFQTTFATLNLTNLNDQLTAIINYLLALLADVNLLRLGHLEGGDHVRTGGVGLLRGQDASGSGTRRRRYPASSRYRILWATVPVVLVVPGLR